MQLSFDLELLNKEVTANKKEEVQQIDEKVKKEKAERDEKVFNQMKMVKELIEKDFFEFFKDFIFKNVNIGSEYLLLSNEYMATLSRGNLAKAETYYPYSDDGIVILAYYKEAIYRLVIKLDYHYDEKATEQNRALLYSYSPYDHIYGYSVCKYTYRVGDWKKLTRIDTVRTPTPREYARYPKMSPITVLGSEYMNIRNEYTEEVLDVLGIPEWYLCVAPQIEQLYKAGFMFIKHLSSMTDWSAFHRLTKPESSMKKIFNIPKSLYNELKDCSDIQTWDLYRKMYNKGIPVQDIIEIRDHNYNSVEINNIYDILRMEHNGKRIFTLSKLVAYLDRIDLNEAISAKEGLYLLKDYLNMCRILDMEPKIDGDSLKREHDVTARLVRQMKDEVMNKRLTEVCKEFEKYNYSENVYFVRTIKSHDDLRDEACQQHNCVASYGTKILTGKCMIFVMREKANPDKSLITIELDKNLNVRQKLLAFNSPIRNKSQTDFINRWVAHIKANKRKAA